MRRPEAGEILALALASVPPAWILGLEQFVPAAILVGGAAWLLAARRLRVPAEAWLFAAFLAATLVSALALDDGSGLILYLRGLANLAAGGAALLLAANQDPAEAPFRLWLCTGSAFLLLLGALAIGVAAGRVPARFPIPFPAIFPDAIADSDFVREHLLERHLARPFRTQVLRRFPRYNGFFFFQGGLAAAILVLQPLILLGRTRLDRPWRRVGVAALTASLAALVMSRSRLGIAFAAAALAAGALWRALASRPWRRSAVRACVALLLLALVWLFVPLGGSAPWERAFVDVRINSFIDRLDTYRATFQRVGERPLFGWGIQEQARDGDGYLRLGTHSEFLNVLYRFGWCGLALYLATWGAVAVRFAAGFLEKAAREDDEELTDLFIVGVALVALAGTALFRELQWDLNVFWLCTALAGTARALSWHRPAPAR